MNNSLWYKNGLRFSCQGCGRCCRGPGGYVWLTPVECWDLAAVLQLDADVFAARYLRSTPEGLALVDSADHNCPFLDELGHCQVYIARPLQCRTWPWWPDNLLSPGAWQRAGRRCPGMDYPNGKLWTVAEITKITEDSGLPEH